jgi:hypothetical protein
VRNKHQRKDRKSNHKFEVVRGQELLVRVPLPMAEVWAEMQAQLEELTGQAGLQILRAILENEVTRRVGPPHRPNPTAGCVRWGKQPGYVVFAGPCGRSSARWRNEDRSISETSLDGWRVGHCAPRLEYAGTVPSAGRLSVRQPENEWQAALLARNATEVLCAASCEAARHREANRLAFFP